jgi:DNA-binding winged helix-turn-helix (wHTH) protein
VLRTQTAQSGKELDESGDLFRTPDITVGKRPDPTIVNQTDAVVRVVFGAVCGSDLWYYRGDSPHTLGPIGHEFIGVVEEVGGDVHGFKKDDFVVAPFTFNDGTCVNCRLGWPSNCLHGGSVGNVGELEIDIVNSRVRVSQSEIHLTSLEQRLLYLLAGNAGRVLSRDDIIDAIWGTEHVADSNIVDQRIHALRAKLQNSCGHPQFIATIPGKGYSFMLESSEPSAG